MSDTAAPSRMETYFKDYSIYHRTLGNQRTHYFGIPMIVVATLGLFAAIPVPTVEIAGSPLLRIDPGLLLWALGSAFYFRLDWRLALPFGILLLGFYYVGRSLSVPLNLGLFVAGWVIQYVGHLKYEKQSPAFYKSLVHLLIGPFWVFAKLVGYRR
ncbi:MAG: DUF962 domain-containing protein [Bdellovibrionales bacterium]|nr:DUF962 domain-containing protein [Bdellovibrionales bacterium]